MSSERRKDLVQENLHIASDVLWAHKLRSSLIILGVAIGVAALMGMVSILLGLGEKITHDIHSSEQTVIMLQKFDFFVGGFDESFPAGAEEIDFAWRAHDRGYRFAYVPDAVILNRIRTDLRGVLRQQYNSGRGTTTLYNKFRPAEVVPTSVARRIHHEILLAKQFPWRGSADDRRRWATLMAFEAGKLVEARRLGQHDRVGELSGQAGGERPVAGAFLLDHAQEPEGSADRIGIDPPQRVDREREHGEAALHVACASPEHPAAASLRNERVA
jgi:hypothetical protein